MKRKKIITYKSGDFDLKISVELVSTQGLMRHEVDRQFTTVIDLLMNSLALRYSVSNIKTK